MDEFALGGTQDFLFAWSAMAPGQRPSNSMQLDQSGDNFSLSFLCKGGDLRQLLFLVGRKNEAYYLKQKKS